MQLLDWQMHLQELIVHPHTDAAHFAKEQLPLTPVAQTADLRLAIYQNAYRLRLTEALRSNFPALHQLLGDNDFNAAANQFLQHNPPTTASIRWFGRALPKWLAETQPYNDVPAVAELAHFEWAIRHALDAADANTATAQQLQTIPSEQWAILSFTLHPSVSVLHTQWNAVAVWQALTNEKVPPTPTSTPSHWVVYRQQNLMNAWRSIELRELNGLELITNGQTFGDLCEHLQQQLGDPQLAINTAASWLKGWLEQNLLVLR